MNRPEQNSKSLCHLFVLFLYGEIVSSAFHTPRGHCVFTWASTFPYPRTIVNVPRNVLFGNKLHTDFKKCCWSQVFVFSLLVLCHLILILMFHIFYVTTQTENLSIQEVLIASLFVPSSHHQLVNEHQHQGSVYLCLYCCGLLSLSSLSVQCREDP